MCGGSGPRGPPVAHALRAGDTAGLPVYGKPRRVRGPARLLVLECRLLRDDPSGTAFVARMYARNVEAGRRAAPSSPSSAAASRSYRRADSKRPVRTHRGGDPVFDVWRAGCDGGRAVSLAMRNDRLNGDDDTPTAPASQRGLPPPPERGRLSACTQRPAPMPPVSPAKSSAGNGRARRRRQADRRAPCRQLHPVRREQGIAVRRCRDHQHLQLRRGGRVLLQGRPRRRIRLSVAAAKDARGQPGPGVTHNLPEYKRGSNSGIALVACKGAMGTVIPRAERRRRKDRLQIALQRAGKRCRSQRCRRLPQSAT